MPLTWLGIAAAGLALAASNLSAQQATPDASPGDAPAGWVNPTQTPTTTAAAAQNAGPNEAASTARPEGEPAVAGENAAGRVSAVPQRDSYRWAFDWSPGILGGVLMLQLVTLAVMGAFRWIAKMLGRGAPGDPFVIFYRVFWQAMLQPSKYPVPVNYQPVPPKEKKADIACETAGLSEGELEELLAGNGDDEDLSERDPLAALERAESAGDSDDEEETGTVAGTEITVRCVGPEATQQIRGFDGNLLIVAVTCSPDSGLANAAALAAAAKVFNIGRHQATLLSGQAKPDKTIKLAGVTPAAYEAKRNSLRAAVAPNRGQPSPRPAPTSDSDSLTFRDD